MIKVSIKLDKRRRLNSGKFPLKFKVARKDSAIYIPTGYELKEDEWDAKNEKVKGLPEQRVINMKLMKRLSLLNDKIVQLQEEGKLRYFSNKKLSLYLSNDEDEQEYKNHLSKLRWMLSLRLRIMKAQSWSIQRLQAKSATIATMNL